MPPVSYGENASELAPIGPNLSLSSRPTPSGFILNTLRKAYVRHEEMDFYIPGMQELRWISVSYNKGESAMPAPRR